MFPQVEVDLAKQIDDPADYLPPQVKIYNRNFYLRSARIQDLQEETNRQIKQLASKPKLTPNSYVILVQKLEQTLQLLMKKYSKQQDLIDFEPFQQIINELGNFSKLEKEEDQFEIQLMVTQLWLVLINYDLKEQYADKNKITSLIHILFCPYMLKVPQMVALLDHAFPDLEQKRLQYIQTYPEVGDEVLNSDGLIRLWLRIKKNHLLHYADRKKPLIVEDQPSFKPEINPKSKEIAKKQLQRYLNNNRLDNAKYSKLNELSGYISGGKELSYHEILYKRNLEKEQILQTSRNQMLPPQKDKTLSNEQTKKLVENLYIIKPRKQDIDYNHIKEQQELKRCTFKPNKTEYRKRSTTPTVRGYSKEVDRLQEGRKKKEKLQQIYENLGRVKKSSAPPPSMVEREKPRLILEIKVGQRIVQLKLKGQEEPRIVAKKFVNKHGLEDSMLEVLESVIEEQLAAL